MENSSYVVASRKVVIVGAGYVGSSIAYALTVRNLAREIVLIDVDKRKSEGEAWDIRNGVSGMSSAVVYAGDYCDVANSDLIIITAGRNRHHGETRLNMIEDNSRIMKSVVNNIMKFYTRGVVLIVSNPVDILVSLCNHWMRLPKGRILGTGCILDSSRMIGKIADYLRVEAGIVKADIVGEHGDSQVPLWSKATVNGIPVAEYCAKTGISWGNEERMRIFEDVKNMGATIIAAKGKTHYGIATCCSALADAVLNQNPIVASVSSPLEGMYTETGVSLSLPSVVGVNGIECKLNEKWNDEEKLLFAKSVESVETVLKMIL